MLRSHAPDCHGSQRRSAGAAVANAAGVRADNRRLGSSAAEALEDGEETVCRMRRTSELNS